MKDLLQQVNAPGSSPEYPRSRIKDDSGLNDGVPVDESVYGDMHQFFQKAVAEVKRFFANQVLDGRNTGYQLFDVIRHLPDYYTLYMHGLFNEAYPTIGPGTLVSGDKITVGQAQVFISDQGVNDVKSYFTEDGVETLTYGNGFLGAASYLQEVFLPSAGSILYVLDTSVPAIRAFRVFDASLAPTLDIITNITAPTCFFASVENNRMYSVDNGFLEVYDLTTAVHIPGEVFNTSADNYTDISVDVIRDRIYILNQTNTRIDVFQISTGANLPGEQVGPLTAPLPAFSIVARKAYVIENSPSVIGIWDLDTLGQLTKEEQLLTPLVPNAMRSIFIRSGYMHLLDEPNIQDLPIRCNAPTEYK